jgi:WD repeat-containing protein 35
MNVVKFYDAYGKFLRYIRIPGENITAVSWEGADLRLSLAVDSFIYFANIRHNYSWTYFLNTVVFSYPTKIERKEAAVVFWDLVSLEAHTKVVTNLKFLVAKGDLCAVVVSEKNLKRSEVNDASSESDLKSKSSTSSKQKIGRTVTGTISNEIYSIQLRNAIGAVVDTKIIPFAPKHVSISSFHVAASNERTVFTWQFQSQVNKTGLGNATTASMLSGATSSNATENVSSTSNNVSTNRGGPAKLRMFDITNTSFSSAQSPETFQMNTEAIADPIVCTTISDKYLMVGKKSGSITRFNLPHLTPENTYTLKDGREPYRMDFNCNSTKIGLIDSNGIFTILDLEARVSDQEEKDKSDGNGANSGASKFILGPHFGKRLNVERKDVWDMKWSEDDPDMVVSCFE